MGKVRQYFVVVVVLLVGGVMRIIIPDVYSPLSTTIVTTSTTRQKTSASPQREPKQQSSSSEVILINSEHGQYDKNTNPTLSKDQIWNITLIVELRGGLGNHLALLASALITQTIAQTTYPNIHIQIIGQHQNHPKWKRAQQDIRWCFPKLRDLVLDGGIHDVAEFVPLQHSQNAWMKRRHFTTQQQELFVNPREEGLAFLHQQLLLLPERPLSLIHNDTMTSRRYSFPYLLTNDFNNIWEEGLKNQLYYENIRRWLQFDTTSAACCGVATIPPIDRTNEVVYHHRNFMLEMNERAIGNHYTEANPETVAFMFGNATKYNRDNTFITITSRYKKGLEPYIASLQNTTGIDIHVSVNRTGVQDFCYLLTTPREIVGKYHSTFSRWAAFLGTATTNRFYGLNQNLDGLDTDSNYTWSDHPIHLLEYIEQSQRSFISEQYWQPQQ